MQWRLEHGYGISIDTLDNPGWSLNRIFGSFLGSLRISMSGCRPEVAPEFLHLHPRWIWT